MLSAARKHKRVVQIGTQRKSTPHLIDVKKQVVDAGLLGTIGQVEMCCYFHMRANGNPEVEPVPDFLDYEMWTGPAPLRPYDDLPHLRWWRTFTEYGNGIVGDMCVHMLDTARWMLNLGWPKRITSAGGIFVQKGGKSNISDTQSACFEYDNYNLNWQHRTWGSPPDQDYPWALFIYGEKGTLKASTMRADFIPNDKNQKPIHFECFYEKEKYPEDNTEERIELNAAPATRRHMLDFLGAIEKRSLPVADIEQGHISTASCILANIAAEIGREVVYDPKKHVVVKDSEATKLLQKAPTASRGSIRRLNMNAFPEVMKLWKRIFLGVVSLLLLLVVAVGARAAYAFRDRNPGYQVDLKVVPRRRRSSPLASRR